MTHVPVWADVLVSVVGGLALAWLMLVVALWRTERRGLDARAAVRLLPDVARLVTRLARDRSLPRGVRVRLWLLLGYLVSPIDVIPDVIPVIGYADDVLIVVLVLRSVVRRVGSPVLVQHWPGTPAGLHALLHVCGLEERTTTTAAPP